MAVSSEREHLIADKVEPDAPRFGEIKIERFDGFFDVRPQLRPGVPLRKNALSQTLRTETAVAFLRHLENDFVHVPQSRTSQLVEQVKGVKRDLKSSG